MKNQIRKSLILFGTAVAVLIFGALVLMLQSVYRNAERFAPIERHLAYVTELRTLERDLEVEIDRSRAGGPTLPDEAVTRLRQQISLLTGTGRQLNEATPAKLQQIFQQLDKIGNRSGIPASQLLDLLGDLIDNELASRQLLLEEISTDIHQEKRVMTLTAVLIPLLVLGLFLVFRQNVVLPARRIAELLGDLGTRNFKIVDTQDTSPTLRPVLENYNVLVARLEELEAASRDRQATLEQQVQSTTGNLMRLHGVLANAQKLAVVGAFAAGVAHELRNPLAGIRTAIDNLRGEIDDPEKKARLDLVIGEMKRMTSLLNNLLEQASVTPESPVRVHIASAVADVVQLARLQLPDTIIFRQAIDPRMRCLLPEDRFRQAILNLLLNSGQVLGDRPGRITIDGSRIDERTRIVVVDDGPGFPTAVLEAGPQAFLTRRDHGTGLGLAIVRRLSRDLDGNLIIGNVKPHGARVELEFPCSECDD